MSAKSTQGPGGKKPASAATNLIAGGGAGMMEALVCHPLDTIKVRMQLSRRARMPGAPKRGFLKTGSEIVKRETALGLYKGLGAVLTGIVPKMAIRFTSYEWYKQMLADSQGNVTSKSTFMAGLAAGVTEAVLVVTPMEVVKIRLQAQHHSMADPLDVPKYRNAAHALYTVLKEEGAGALWRGVSLTALRQGTNQAANFTAYSELRSRLQAYQGTTDLPGWQTSFIGLISGAMGPFSNAPIDTIKTRLQKTPAEPGQSAMSRITAIAADMWKQEGVRSFYKGITPRVMRVAPGQAVTFTVYEYLKGILEKGREMIPGASQELKSALGELIVSSSQRGLIARIDKETIVPGATISSSASTFLDDLSNLSTHVKPNEALYILLRRADSLSSPDKSLVAVTYVPNAAPVRQKMLFASTRLTLVRELGGEHFPESIFTTESDELTASGWTKHVQHTESANPLTTEEQSLQDIKEAEALESRGTRGQSLAQGGRLAIRADDEIAGALQKLSEGGDNLVQLRMDSSTETLCLVSSSSATLSTIASAIDPKEPRYSFYRHDDPDASIVFISTCPSAAKIKERMLYAASRGNVVALAQGDGGLKVAKKLEATNPDEITEEVILDEFKVEKVEVKQGFSKPKRPGRR
ncbi:Mitochondrial succinate-fumarate transporter [Neodidymelliopsis sp. IMI 364377]|nr:Mitochondrial succinate-fumarate transporter [Neodidymelliopsis sp. IMI 364377]